MKVNSLLLKTALAAAVASVSFGVTAATVPLGVATPVVLANEIFGTGSETSIVQLPVLTFVGNDVSTSTAESTIKLTLGGQAVFGEVYDDPAGWAAQNIVVNVGGTVLSDANATVTAGGTRNDNQITIRVAAGLDLSDITISGFKAQGLKSALERQSGTPVRNTTAALEVREDATDAASPFDNTRGTAVIYSIDGITLKAAPTSYEGATGGRARINVASDQLLFTGATGSAAAADFDATASQAVVDLGTITIARNDLVPGGAVGTGLGIPAGKEDGTLFDFTGSDVLTLGLEGSAALAGYGVFTLRTGGCSGAVISTGTISGSDVNFPFTNTAVLDTPLQVCAVAPGNVRIAESSFAADLGVTYFSARYTDSAANQNLGRVLRNGCQVTLFNLPNVNAADNAFIRFTNTSELDGQVNAYVWTEDGQQVDLGAEVLSNLDAHATAIFHTNANQASGVYLGDVLPEFAETSGRSRIVLQGAFPSCEALGLVRSNNGTLVNMTSTTYSDGINSLQENGTSNTTN